jgi:hypothetical protein
VGGPAGAHSLPTVQTFTPFSEPAGDAVVLTVRLGLESWERADHPEQRALREYLDHLAAAVGPHLQEHQRRDLAVSLHVGLPSGAPLIGAGADLDNFLYPVVRRLGPGRFASAWAVKEHGFVHDLRATRDARRG